MFGVRFAGRQVPSAVKWLWTPKHTVTPLPATAPPFVGKRLATIAIRCTWQQQLPFVFIRLHWQFDCYHKDVVLGPWLGAPGICLYLTWRELQVFCSAWVRGAGSSFPCNLSWGDPVS